MAWDMHEPLARSYWVLPGRLLAGPYPGSPDAEEEEVRVAALLDAGIRCFINLMREDEGDLYGRPFWPYEHTVRRLAAEAGIRVHVHRFEIEDMGIPAHALMREILDTIDDRLAAPLPVYVHCLGGVGRTGTVVGCYLARHGIAEGDGALEAIGLLRGSRSGSELPSPQTREQCAFVRSWSRDR